VQKEIGKDNQDKQRGFDLALAFKFRGIIKNNLEETNKYWQEKTS